MLPGVSAGLQVRHRFSLTIVHNGLITFSQDASFSKLCLVDISCNVSNRDDNMAETLWVLARPLISVARAILRPVRGVYRERQAGQLPFGGGTNLLDQRLHETMSRLRGGNIDANWWQNLLN